MVFVIYNLRSTLLLTSPDNITCVYVRRLHTTKGVWLKGSQVADSELLVLRFLVRFLFPTTVSLKSLPLKLYF